MTFSYFSDLDAFELYHLIQEEGGRGATSSLSITSALKHAVTGSAGSALSNIVVYPLDLVVTRLQVQQRSGKKDDAEHEQNETQYASVIDAIQKIYHNEGGLPAFYSGVFDDTARTMLDSFLFFLAYNFLWRARGKVVGNGSNSKTSNEIQNTIASLAVGVIAGSFTKAVTTPIQTLVTRKQTAAMASTNSKNGAQKQGVRQIAKAIYYSQGLPGFWAGYPASIFLTLNPSITFFVDALLRRLLNSSKNPSAVLTFLVAATGKATASTIMYPFTLAKARAQAAGAKSTEDKSSDKKLEDSKSGKPGAAGVLSAIPQIANSEGFTGLYAGWSGEVVKGFMSHGLTMLIKERVSAVAIALYYALASFLQSRSPLKPMGKKSD